MLVTRLRWLWPTWIPRTEAGPTRESNYVVITRVKNTVVSCPCWFGFQFLPGSHASRFRLLRLRLDPSCPGNAVAPATGSLARYSVVSSDLCLPWRKLVVRSFVRLFLPTSCSSWSSIMKLELERAWMPDAAVLLVFFSCAWVVIIFECWVLADTTLLAS